MDVGYASPAFTPATDTARIHPWRRVPTMEFSASMAHTQELSRWPIVVVISVLAQVY